MIASVLENVRNRLRIRSLVRNQPMFSSVEMQIISWCNRDCVFCPANKFEIEKRQMEMPLLERISDELRELDFRGRISFHMNCEPLLDSRLPEICALFRQKCPEAWIYLNSNGDPVLGRQIEKPFDELSRQKIKSKLDALYDGGLNHLMINVYDGDGRVDRVRELLRGYAGSRPGLEWIESDREARHRFGRGTGRGRTCIQVRDASYWTEDFRGKNLTRFKFGNRAGNTPGARDVREPLNLPCLRPTHQLYINYKGQTVVCSNDWKSEAVLGDIREKPLSKIWYDAPYQRYRKALLAGNRNLTLCAKCDAGLDSEAWE